MFQDVAKTDSNLSEHGQKSASSTVPVPKQKPKNWYAMYRNLLVRRGKTPPSGVVDPEKAAKTHRQGGGGSYKKSLERQQRSEILGRREVEKARVFWGF